MTFYLGRIIAQRVVLYVLSTARNNIISESYKLHRRRFVCHYILLLLLLILYEYDEACLGLRATTAMI